MFVSFSRKQQAGLYTKNVAQQHSRATNLLRDKKRFVLGASGNTVYLAQEKLEFMDNVEIKYFIFNTLRFRLKVAMSLP
jgi:hypothetical protein